VLAVKPVAGAGAIFDPQKARPVGEAQASCISIVWSPNQTGRNQKGAVPEYS